MERGITDQENKGVGVWRDRSHKRHAARRGTRSMDWVPAVKDVVPRPWLVSRWKLGGKRRPSVVVWPCTRRASLGTSAPNGLRADRDNSSRQPPLPVHAPAVRVPPPPSLQR